MSGKQYIGQNKTIVLDTKKNIFGLTDVMQKLRKDGNEISVPLTEVVDTISSPITIQTSDDIQQRDISIVVTDVTGVLKGMVFKFEENSVVEYKVVRDVSSVTNRITFTRYFDNQFTSNQTITQVGNTGYYKGQWLVQQDQLGGIQVGSDILVDVQSKEGGFLFEGQLLTIEEDIKTRFDIVDSNLDLQLQHLESLTGGTQIDISRILL